jgi:peptidoglycan/LPS O-acetylase OafA/YrhL
MAALTVIAFHVGHLTTPQVATVGQFHVLQYFNQGLTLFFVLSGFLLFRPFVSSLIAGSRRPTARRFWTNRALRIFPAYIVIVLVVNALGFSKTPNAGVEHPYGVVHGWQLLIDTLLLQGLQPMTLRTGIEVAWTLSVELSFYLVLPVLAAVGFWLARRRLPALVGALTPPLVLLVGALAGRYLLFEKLQGMGPVDAFAAQWGPTWTAVVARSLFLHADLFAYGMLAAVLYVLIESGHIRRRAVRWMRPFFALGALLALYGFFQGWGGAYGDGLVAITAALILLTAVVPGRNDKPGILGLFLELAPVRWFGLISYSAYLWHLPIIRWVQTNLPAAQDSRRGFLLSLALVLVLTTAFSALTYYAVETPALKLKAWFMARAKLRRAEAEPEQAPAADLVPVATPDAESEAGAADPKPVNVGV